MLADADRDVGVPFARLPPQLVDRILLQNLVARLFVAQRIARFPFGDLGLPFAEVGQVLVGDRLVEIDEDVLHARGGVNNGTPGTPTATGDLNSTDVDNPNDTWQAVAAGAATTNGYGTYALDAVGVWSYTLDNTNAAVQALNVGQTLTDTFTALTADGTTQVVTITIDGTDDAAVISGTASGNVTEAGGVGSGIPGIPVVVGNLDFDRCG